MDRTRRLAPEELRAWQAFQRMAVSLGARLHRRLLEASGVSLPDFEVLTALVESTEARLRAFELGTGLHWEKSRLSHHLRRMENRGLIDRVVCESDGRGLWVSLTATGREAWENASRVHDEGVRALMLDQLDPDSIASLSEIAEKVMAGLPDDTDLCDR